MPPQDEVMVATNLAAAERSDEQQALIKSLSFSSSEDGHGGTAITMELLKQLQEDVTATRSSSTNFPLHELFRGASYLSASENTAVVSNVQSPSSRELQQSPPLILGDGVAGDELQERESKRSIFGRKERKKYNVRQHEARNDSNTQQQQQQNYGLVSPLSK